MAGSLAILQGRYPDLFDLVSDYVRRIAGLPEDERRKFWLCRAAAGLADRPEHFIGKMLSKLNDVVVEVRHHPGNTIVLKAKLSRCLPARPTVHRESYDSQLRDTFAEMLGYAYLCDKGCAAPRFIPEGEEPRPDLEAPGPPGRKPVVMECKNLHESDEQKDYFAYHQGEARTVDYRLVSEDADENPLLRKLLDMAKRAVKQLAAYDPSQYGRIFFLNYSLDIGAGLIGDEFPKAVGGVFRQVASQLDRQGVELVLMDRYGLGELIEVCPQ